MAGSEGRLEGNMARARELLKESGYDGTPIVILQPFDLTTMRQLAPVAKSQLEKAGFKVDVQTMDWQSLVARLINKKGPPSEGGWNAFGTSWSQVDILDPLMTGYLGATCAKAYAGWPCDEEMEKLRDAYVRAEGPQQQKEAAEAVQRHAYRIVTHIPLGEWFGVMAVRSTVVTPEADAAGHGVLGLEQEIAALKQNIRDSMGADANDTEGTADFSYLAPGLFHRHVKIQSWG